MSDDNLFRNSNEMRQFLTREIVTRFALISIGHPVIFFLYIFMLPRDFILRPFFELETSVYRINIILFILFAFLIYSFWCYFLMSNFAMLRKNKIVNTVKFLDAKLGKTSLLISKFGAANILVLLVGVHGNWGNFCILPLFILSIFSLVEFVTHTKATFAGNYDKIFTGI
jgi:hypothetical protein